MKILLSPDTAHLAEITLSPIQTEHFWDSPGNTISIDIGGVVVELKSVNPTDNELASLLITVTNEGGCIGQPFHVGSAHFSIT